MSGARDQAPHLSVHTDCIHQLLLVSVCQLWRGKSAEQRTHQLEVRLSGESLPGMLEDLGSVPSPKERKTSNTSGWVLGGHVKAEVETRVGKDCQLHHLHLECYQRPMR